MKTYGAKERTDCKFGFNSNKAQWKIFLIVEKIVFAVTSRILRIIMEHVEKIQSFESKLFLVSVYSVEILNTLEVGGNANFLKNPKVLNSDKEDESKSRKKST